MNPARTAMAAAARLRTGMSKTTMGVLLMLLITAASATVYYKEHITTTVSGMFGHDTVKAEFAKANQLVEFRHGGDVKIAGVRVGTVTDLEETEAGTSIVTMQVNDGVREKLGSTPSAQIYPTLMLDGRWFISLRPGGEGDFGNDMIPLGRTNVPVSFGRVLSALTPPAREGIQAAVTQLDGVLKQGGSDALRDLMRDAPGTLEPSGDVLEAFQGTRPGDLTRLVTGLRNTAAAFTERGGQVDAVLDSVHGSTAALAAGSRPWAESIETMPETMRTTRAGMADLQPTLDRLAESAENFRPAARQMDPFFAQLDPVLARTRPLLGDLRSLLVDARPLVERLVPVTRESTKVFDDLSGPVLDRLNGPMANTVMSPWKGTGQYEGGGASGHLFYEELGYLASRASQVFGWHDKTGAHARLSVGVGLNTAGSAAGVHMSLEQYLEMLGFQQPPGPQAYAPKSESSGSGPNSPTRDASPAAADPPLPFVDAGAPR